MLLKGTGPLRGEGSDEQQVADDSFASRRNEGREEEKAVKQMEAFEAVEVMEGEGSPVARRDESGLKARQ